MNNHILRVFSDEMFCCVTPIVCTADDPIDRHDQMRRRIRENRPEVELASTTLLKTWVLMRRGSSTAWWVASGWLSASVCLWVGAWGGWWRWITTSLRGPAHRQSFLHLFPVVFFSPVMGSDRRMMRRRRHRNIREAMLPAKALLFL